MVMPSYGEPCKYPRFPARDSPYQDLCTRCEFQFSKHDQLRPPMPTPEQVIPTYSLPPCPPVGTILSGGHKGSNPDQIPSVFVVVDDSTLSKTNATHNVNWGQALLEYGPLTVIGNVPGE